MCSQTVHHWKAHTFAFGSQKSTTGSVRYFKRQEWGRPRSQMYLRLREIGHGRRQRWGTGLRAGVEGKSLQTNSCSPTQPPKDWNGEMLLKRYWRVSEKILTFVESLIKKLVCSLVTLEWGLQCSHPTYAHSCHIDASKMRQTKSVKRNIEEREYKKKKIINTLDPWTVWGLGTLCSGKPAFWLPRNLTTNGYCWLEALLIPTVDNIYFIFYGLAACILTLC